MLKEIGYSISCVPSSLMEGHYYLINFKGGLWPGQLIQLTNFGAVVKCLQKAAVFGSICIWPKKLDKEEYVLKDIHQEIETPLNCGSKT